jgi:hypothetical protein
VDKWRIEKRQELYLRVFNKMYSKRNTFSSIGTDFDGIEILVETTASSTCFSVFFNCTAWNNMTTNISAAKMYRLGSVFMVWILSIPIRVCVSGYITVNFLQYFSICKAKILDLPVVLIYFIDNQWSINPDLSFDSWRPVLLSGMS